MPVSNVVKVMDKPTGEFKCVLTRDTLFSLGDILEGIQSEEFKTNFMNHLKSMFDENSNQESPMAKLVGEKKLGLTGKDTNTFMSYPAFQEFYNWTVTKALKGDKHINWLLGSIRHNTLVSRGEKIKDATVVNKVDKIKKQDNKGATYTIGDLGVLQALKDKMEKEGN